MAIHGGHLGGTTKRLLHLFAQYGPYELEAALAEACRRSAFAAQSVAHVLDQRRRAKSTKAPVPPVLPNDPRVRDLVVAPRKLSDFDALARAGKDRDREEDGHE